MSFVIFSPTVFITLWPYIANPVTIPTPPRSKIKGETVAFDSMTPPDEAMEAIAANGPIALATSFDP